MEEDSEESFVVESVNNSHHLTDTVHGQAGSSNVEGLDSSLRCHHRTNSATTHRIVSHDEILEGNVNSGTKSTEDSSADRVSHVALVGVQLEDNSLLEFRLVLRLMQVAVVRMHSMGQVSRKDKTAVNSSEIVFLRSIFRCSSKDTLSSFNSHVTVSTLGRLRANFLMIEKHDHVDLRVVTLVGRNF